MKKSLPLISGAALACGALALVACSSDDGDATPGSPTVVESNGNETPDGMAAGGSDTGSAGDGAGGAPPESGGDGGTPTGVGGAGGSGLPMNDGGTNTGAVGSGGDPNVLTGCTGEGDATALPALLFDVYSPTGWSGDSYQNDPETLQSNLQVGECEDRGGMGRGVCSKFTYSAGELGWGGIFYQNADQNWDCAVGPGLDLSTVRAVRFQAKGATGGEVVTFGAFGQVMETVTLTDEWTEVVLDVSGVAEAAASNVDAAFNFAVAVAEQTDAGAPVTFYVDDAVLATE